MPTIICDLSKGGCGMSFEVDKESIKKDKYIQCIHCGRVDLENPFYEWR